MKKFDIRELGFDEWGSAKIQQDIVELRGSEDFLVMVRQGFKSMSPPFAEFLRLLTKGQIRHGGNPVLRWMADNTVAAKDPAGNIKPEKSKARNRIDGIVAAIMALSRAQVHSQVKIITQGFVEI
jgi:phage terminase large subunit-like protein